MLKRLSGTFSQSSDQLLLPPSSPNIGFNSSSSAPSSPHSFRSNTSHPGGYPFPTVPQQPPAPVQSGGIDRSTLHRTLSLLSTLLVALDELRSASLLQSKAQKKVSKALKELGQNAWGDKSTKDAKDSTIADALLASSAMYETLGEVDQKLAKFVQNEYESINDFTSKYFKKTAKEEKAFDDSLSSLDSKVSKATISYNKQASRQQQLPTQSYQQLDSLTASHSTYISTLQSLQFQANQLQASYGVEIKGRREKVGREVARCLTGLAEKSWMSKVEGVRKGGEVVGRVFAKGVWVGEGMERVGEFERKGEELRGGRYEADEERGKEEPRGDSNPQQTRAQAQSSNDRERPRNGAESNTSVVRRGPRAPSTSTTNTQNTTSVSTAPSISAPRSPPLQLASPPTPQPYPDSMPGALPSPSIQQSTRIDSPSSTTRRESLDFPPEPASLHATQKTSTSPPIELGGGRTLPRGWYLDPSFANHFDQENGPLSPIISPRLGQFEPDPALHNEEERSKPRPPPMLSERRQTYEGLSTKREGEEMAQLRKPTPRYGSAPPNTGTDQVDEWGRTTGDNARGGEGRESFVRRMSQKYGANENTHDVPRQQVSSPSVAPPHHNRSDSRVSLLAKRYSSPPDPSYPTSPTTEAAPTRRPLPPTHRPSTSVQFQPPREYASTSDNSAPSSTSYSSTHSRSQPHLTSTMTPTTSTSSHTTTSSEPHPVFCACQTCTTLHYSQSGKEQLTRAEEERLQRDLRAGTKGGTLKGLVGKGKEVFGRMG